MAISQLAISPGDHDEAHMDDLGDTDLRPPADGPRHRLDPVTAR